MPIQFTFDPFNSTKRQDACCAYSSHDDDDDDDDDNDDVPITALVGFAAKQRSGPVIVYIVRLADDDGK